MAQTHLTLVNHPGCLTLQRFCADLTRHRTALSACRAPAPCMRPQRQSTHYSAKKQSACFPCVDSAHVPSAPVQSCAGRRWSAIRSGSSSEKMSRPARPCSQRESTWKAATVGKSGWHAKLCARQTLVRRAVRRATCARCCRFSRSSRGCDNSSVEQCARTTLSMCTAVG